MNTNIRISLAITQHITTANKV